MNYYIASVLPFDTNKINSFRKKWDPKVDLVPPHITLVFPLPPEIDEHDLVSHVENIVSEVNPFNVEINGVDIMPDYFMYLAIKEGSFEVTKLHDKLYSGILESFLRKDIPFVPHSTIGYFETPSGTLDQNSYEIALKEAKAQQFNYKFLLNKVSLLGIENVASPRLLIKDFQLGNSL